jgi:hypothetical protein
MTIRECTSSVQQATAKMRSHTLRSMLAIEPVILPAWRQKPRVPKKRQSALTSRQTTFRFCSAFWKSLQTLMCGDAAMVHQTRGPQAGFQGSQGRQIPLNPKPQSVNSV